MEYYGELMIVLAFCLRLYGTSNEDELRTGCNGAQVHAAQECHQHHNIWKSVDDKNVGISEYRNREKNGTGTKSAEVNGGLSYFFFLIEIQSLLHLVHEISHNAYTLIWRFEEGKT